MRAIVTVVLLALFATSARAGDAVGAYAPYEDLLEVLAPVTWHLKDDLYRFPPPRDYSSLSVKDLLDARDAYHLHLSHLDSVVATAISRYRIRKGDWYEKHPPSEPRPADFPRVAGERTLYNSVVTDWSWPCVLVFVNRIDQSTARAIHLKPVNVSAKLTPWCSAILPSSADETSVVTTSRSAPDVWPSR